MNKHYTFKTGLFISILILLILICIGTFTRLFIVSKSDKNDSVRVALITDSEDMKDASFNQCAYEGIKKYCEAAKITYASYKPADSTTESSLSSIDEAVKNGAELIICPDSKLSETVYQAQSRYKNTYFILVDAEPVSTDGSLTETADNVTSLLFDDDEAGFLAGYSCVSCGYKTIAVMYNSDSTSDVHYYYGFLQGADYAAKEAGVNITLKSRDIRTAKDSEISRFAKKTYGKGTEVIFTCNNDVCKTVSEQAAECNGLIINAGSNLTDLPAVAGSITKNISNAVYRELEAFYSDNFSGGNVTTFNTSNDGLIFVTNHDLLKDFPTEKYQDVCNKLSDDSILLISDTTMDIEDLDLRNTTIKISTPSNK